jgi:hypothetical protein
MTDYRFSLIVASPPLTEDQILDVADALGDAGCNDASIRGHIHGLELLFDRAAESLQAAIVSAISGVESAGYRVSRIEMERECLPA